MVVLKITTDFYIVLPPTVRANCRLLERLLTYKLNRVLPSAAKRRSFARSGESGAHFFDQNENRIKMKLKSNENGPQPQLCQASETAFVAFSPNQVRTHAALP